MSVFQDLAAVAVSNAPTGSYEYSSTFSDGEITESEYDDEYNDKKTKNKGGKGVDVDSIKLSRASPRLLLLITCLTFIATALSGINLGLLMGSKYIKIKYSTATDKLNVHNTTLGAKMMLYSELDALVSHPLPRVFLESYEECLVRGLRVANYDLSGRCFEYEDTREKVVEWTTEACHRHKFTPQVIIKAPTSKQRLEQHWADFQYRSLHMAETVVGCFKHFKQKMHRFYISLDIVNVLEKGLGGSKKDNEPSAFQNDIVDIIPNGAAFPTALFGFQLDCEPNQLCHLTYTPSSNSSITHAEDTIISPTYLEHLHRQMDTLSSIRANFEKATYVTIPLSAIFFGLQLILIAWATSLSLLDCKTIAGNLSYKSEQATIFCLSLSFQYSVVLAWRDSIGNDKATVIHGKFGSSLAGFAFSFLLAFILSRTFGPFGWIKTLYRIVNLGDAEDTTEEVAQEEVAEGKGIIVTKEFSITVKTIPVPVACSKPKSSQVSDDAETGEDADIDTDSDAEYEYEEEEEEEEEESDPESEYEFSTDIVDLAGGLTDDMMIDRNEEGSEWSMI